jgi:hypothetical protein
MKEERTSLISDHLWSDTTNRRAKEPQETTSEENDNEKERVERSTSSVRKDLSV